MKEDKSRPKETAAIWTGLRVVWCVAGRSETTTC